MQIYFKVVLPYFFMLVLNYYVVKYSFVGMTAPYDWSFATGLLALGALVVADVKFIISRVTKIAVFTNSTQEENHEDKSSV